jgi:quercetin dioxygenase-like cupin family protein
MAAGFLEAYERRVELNSIILCNFHASLVSMKIVKPGEHPKLETVKGRHGEIIIVGEKAMMMRLTVEPNVPTPPHSHPHEQMGLVIQGEGTLYIGDEKVHVKEGTSFWVPPDAPHNFDATGDRPAVLV